MSAYLSRTPGSTTNRRTFTFSTWIKRGAMADNECVFSQCSTSTYNSGTHFRMRFGTSHNLQVAMFSTDVFYTNAAYDDPTAWYNIVLAVDTTQVTDTDRVKLYVNGVQETSFSTTSWPSQDFDTGVNVSGSPILIGADDSSAGSPSAFILSTMAHTHFIDGTAYAASTFGETDSTSGIWVPKTAPSVTYGTNGFFLKYATGATGTDSSGNGNTMTVTGTLNQTKDTPSNNFATLNSIQPVSGGFKPQSGATFANGNNVFSTNNSSGNWGVGQSTLSFQKGKWYAECYIQQDTSDDATVGIRSGRPESVADYLGDLPQDYSYYADNGSYYNNNSATVYGNSYATGSYIGVYVDADNNKLYFAKDGTIQNSGTGITISDLTDTASAFYTIGCSLWSSGTATAIFHWNFGNGIFGTTALGGTTYADAGGEGTFKYDPSAGTFDGSSKDFRALCTNNIATYGG